MKDVEFLARAVSVAAQRTRGLKGRMITGDPKWYSHRTIAAPAGVIDLLTGHMRRRGLSAGDPDALLFVGPGGAPLHYSNWRRRVALAIDVKTAQTRAGHRDAKTTLDIYARPTREADRAAAELLGKYFLDADAERRGIDAG